MAVGGSNMVRVLDTSNIEFKEVKADAIDLEPNQVSCVTMDGVSS